MVTGIALQKKQSTKRNFTNPGKGCMLFAGLQIQKKVRMGMFFFHFFG